MASAAERSAMAAAGSSEVQGPSPGTSAHHPAPPSDDVVVLLLAQLSPGSRGWGWLRVARGGRALHGVPGLRFAKALGSGFEGGFGLRPSLSRQGLLAVFDGEAAAAEFAQRSALAAEYRARSDESLTLTLRATSARGRWDGTAFVPTRAAPTEGPVAALTRASIRPHKAWSFWRQSPAAERDLAQACGCRLAMGLGEAPVLRQATFSLWDDQAAMDRYARSGAHLAAIHAAAQGRFFSESLFVRFVLMSAQGRWRGREHA